MTYGHDYPQLVIKYEDLLFNLSSAVEQIRTFIPNLKTFDKVETTLHSFLNPNLQHQKKMLNL